MPKVTVIIPVYNSEEYICRCLESVMNQTLIDTEIICIDDCSNDQSKRLLEQYAKLDARIRVFYNERNRGQAFSRNKGIEAARGEYIQFLDSDDYLSKEDVLEFLYSVASANRLDLLKNEWIVLENGVKKEAIPYPECLVENVCSGGDLLYQLECHNICAWSTCSSFVKLDFLHHNGISFYHDIIHEDVLFSYNLFYFAERAMCVNKYTYFYIKHDNSTTTKPKDISHVRGYLVGMNEIIKSGIPSASVKFRYATIKYLIRMYNVVVAILKELNYSITVEMFDDELRDLYHMLWDAGDVFYINKNIINQNISKMNQDKKIYVYGAGKAAKELLEILTEHDVAIDGVFVTDMKNSSKTLLGHRVLSIEDCNCSDKNALFLVAITQKYVGNVIELLCEKGFKNIIYVC